MTFNTYILHKLNGKGFDELYTTHKKKWDTMVLKAAEEIKECLAENEPIKAGDVEATVEHGVSVSREFESHLALKKLKEKYWAARFAAYIVEQNYPHAEIKIK